MYYNDFVLANKIREVPMLYPLMLKPVYKDYLWGGRTLSRWGKTLPQQGKVAESWELSGHARGESIVQNGPLQGKTLPQVLKAQGRQLVGSLASAEDLDQFPLLIKLIDAHDRLSVQVHPDDAYAQKHAAGEKGKSEMWYVLEAGPGASLIAGVHPGTTQASFAKALDRGECLSQLQSLPVKAGDVINIPAGLVHAIGAGLVILEIQQSSDTTYRVYDYDRIGADGKKRPLHRKEALDVIRFDLGASMAKVEGIVSKEDDLVRRLLVLNRYLKSEHWQLTGTLPLAQDGTRFLSMTVLSGQGTLKSRDEQFQPVPLSKGCTVLLPAALEGVIFEGRLEAITATIADFDRDLAAAAQAAGLPNQGCTDAAAWLQRLRSRIGLDPLPSGG